MQFTDTHTHLYDEAFIGDIGKVLGRATEAGVSKMILPDIDSLSRGSMFNLADSYPGILFPCLGVHPTSVNKNWKDEISRMEAHLSRKIYAIGEVGIDCHWSVEHLEEQIKTFRYMLETAHRLSLPVIIHSRESTEVIIKVLKEYKHLNLRGVFHAYSGSIETFRQIQSTGEWYIGIGGVLTFKKASIAETVKNIPLERILLETDSPYLTPVPYRGQRNESAYIPLIASVLAELKGVDITEVAEKTTDNAEKLFGI